MKKILAVILMVVISTMTYFFWEANYKVAAIGSVSPANVRGNIFVQIWGKNASGGNIWVGCIIKPDSNGKWLIIGGSHQNVGCSGVSQDDSSIYLRYPRMTKIVS